MQINTATRYWLVVILVLASVLLGISSLLLWVIFPLGYFPSRIVWLGIHKWSGFTLYIAVIIHLALHWNWLIRMTKRYMNPWRNTKNLKH